MGFEHTRPSLCCGICHHVLGLDPSTRSSHICLLWAVGPPQLPKAGAGGEQERGPQAKPRIGGSRGIPLAPGGLEGWVHGKSLHQLLLGSVGSCPCPGRSLGAEADVEGQRFSI